MPNPWHLLIIFLAAGVAFSASIIYVVAMDASMPTAVEERAVTGPTVLPDRSNCDEIYGTAYRSQSEHKWFSENCSAWSAAVGPQSETDASPESRPRAEPTPTSPPPEGRDCNQIRGRAYRSAAERDWYLANCQGRSDQQPDQSQQQASAEPDRTNCDEIRNTPYRSNSERDWFRAHCGDQQANAGNAGPDRTNCDEIRSTPYRSDNERAWYLANCRQQPQQSAPTNSDREQNTPTGSNRNSRDDDDDDDDDDD